MIPRRLTQQESLLKRVSPLWTIVSATSALTFRATRAWFLSIAIALTLAEARRTRTGRSDEAYIFEKRLVGLKDD